jgi:tryptophan 2-C-methyltransferase
VKVLLVNTNTVRPVVAPIGLDYCADTLRAAGHEVALLDLCFSESKDRDISTAMELTPDVVGVTVRNIDDCYAASKAFFLSGIRDIVFDLKDHTDAPVVLGGIGVSLMPEAVIEYCGADFGIAGEGEAAFPELLEALRGDSGLEDVNGLVWWDEVGPRVNRPREISLDKLPPRTRSLVDNARYFAEGGQAGFETKRGCGQTCIYCADPVVRGKRTRLLSPRMVVEELKALLAQGIDHLHTCDCEFNMPLEHAKAVCQAIIEGGLAERLRWYAYCAPVPFDAEAALLFRRAGCAGIDFGVDSGSAEMLRRLGRLFQPEDLVATAAACREAGIPIMYDLLIGAPGETKETLRESLDLVRRAGPDCVGVSLGVRVFEGTPLAAQVRQQGPLGSNLALSGAKLDNERLLRPIFYLAPALGSDPEGLVREAVAGDERFFLPGGPSAERDYNYNDNDILTRAIADGARGAYWDILRRARAG